MKRTALICSLAAILTGAASASAAPYFTLRPATVAEQRSADTIARAYWRAHEPAGYGHDGMPPCGAPRFSWAKFPAFDQHAAETHVDGSCRIVFNSAVWLWPAATHQANVLSGGDAWPSFCTAVAHEWGHLILGGAYFALANPADPGHSPDPRSLMYASPVHDLPACERTPDPGMGHGPARDRSTAGKASRGGT